jgi:S1-C subfamily serine protease
LGMKQWMAQALRTVLPALALLVGPTGSPRAQGTLSALQTDVDAIARRARPSVVTVFAMRTEVSPKNAPASSAPRVRTRAGSGVAVESDLVLTTASVVLDAERTLISTAQGQQVEAEIVGVDPVFNLALLHVSSLRLPPLRFAAGRPARVGDWVVSLGTSYNAQPTQSLGNVAQRHREPGQSLLQLTNTVYPGNSGAAALNIRGELVGVVQGELGSPSLTGSAADDGRQPGAASFAMPVETLKPVFESLKRQGRVRHGYLGVTTLAASLESDREGGPSTPLGALVEGIIGGGPAERVGLRPGDLIVAFDGERVETPEQLARWVLATPPGRDVTLVWVRRDIGHSGSVLLRESPDRVPEWLAGAAADAPEGPRKVAELEREIRRLSHELARRKEPAATPPH